MSIRQLVAIELGLDPDQFGKDLLYMCSGCGVTMVSSPGDLCPECNEPEAA
jgi:rubrerythrin